MSQYFSSYVFIIPFAIILLSFFSIFFLSIKLFARLNKYILNFLLFLRRPTITFYRRYYLLQNGYVGGSYVSELLILIFMLGAIWWSILFIYHGISPIRIGDWPENYFLWYAFCQRIFIFHFFFYLLCIKVFKSWFWFRRFFVLYFLIEIFSCFIPIEIIYLPSIQLFVDFWYYAPIFFKLSIKDINFFLIFYYFSYSFLIALFFILMLYSIFKIFNSKISSVSSTEGYFIQLKCISSKNLVKESYFFLYRFIGEHPDFLLAVLGFYIWGFFFGGLPHTAENVFHGPFFWLNIAVLSIKILTLNYYLLLFFFWFAFFNFIYFWLIDIKDSNVALIFIKKLYFYYFIGREAGILDISAFRRVSYLFLCFVLPLIMTFDLSLLSCFLFVYFFFLDVLQFWVTLGVLLSFLWIAVLSIMPNNDPEHAQSNARLFCVWIFNLSLFISVFFVNASVLYAASPEKYFSSELLCADNSIFVDFFAPIDWAWISAVNVPFSDFLPFLDTGVFTLGYDYFAVILCCATSLIFSFVFLMCLFSQTINRKRYFFFNLLLIELCIILAFLSLNLLGFFVFFESSLFPMFLIIGLWGSSDRRWFAAKQMLFYSLLASTPMIICIVHFYSTFGSLDYLFLYNSLPLMSENEKYLLWFSFFFMFATKIPMFPFHSWLLNAHVEAPTGGSIILAAILLKLGIFGMVRYLIHFLGEISLQMSFFVLSLALIGVLYSSVCAITELDCKRLIAHTSIAHMNLCVIGLFIFDERGLSGAIYLAIGHVVTSSALFFLIGVLYDRFHTRNLLVFGGLVQLMPIFSSFLFFFAMANSGFPWTLSFIGEFLILAGMARKLSLLVYLIIIIASVSLFYANLRLFVFICFGTINKNLIHNSVSDLTLLELYCVFLFACNGFILMWNSDLFFGALYADNFMHLVF